MSIQEMKSRIHQLVDQIDDEPTLEQLLNDANQYAADDLQPQASLNDLADTHRIRLEQAMRDHQEGKTISHEAMKQRHQGWLNKLNIIDTRSGPDKNPFAF